MEQQLSEKLKQRAGVRDSCGNAVTRNRARAAMMKAERERQLVAALEEYLAPVVLYIKLISTYAELGDSGGVCYAMNNLLSCVRAAAITHRELAALRASKEAT